MAEGLDKSRNILDGEAARAGDTHRVLGDDVLEATRPGIAVAGAASRCGAATAEVARGTNSLTICVGAAERSSREPNRAGSAAAEAL